MISVDISFKGTYHSVRGVKTRQKVALIIIRLFFQNFDTFDLLMRHLTYICNNFVHYCIVLSTVSEVREL